jgi:hypothetical protein
MLASLALVAIIVPAWGQKRMPREETFRRSVDSGNEVRVFTYAQWHRDCTPREPPRISLRVLPAHGTATLRPGPSTVAIIREGMPDCTGKTYAGIGVWYTPFPGFHGADQFDWDVVGETTVSHDTAIIEVK